eukprot:12145395-Alexandrium_andersonii.AAC.1
MVLSSALASRRPFPAKRATRKALADARGGPQVWYSSKTAVKPYVRCLLAVEERSLCVVLVPRVHPWPSRPSAPTLPQPCHPLVPALHSPIPSPEYKRTM